MQDKIEKYNNKLPALRGDTIQCLDKGYVRLVDYMGTDMRIVEAARVSYGAHSKGEEQDKKLLFYLYKNKHTSPFEMCKITLDFKMPIFVARQYVRHRMQNMNEFSMRYKEAPEEFYIPTEWRAQDNKNKQGSLTTNFNPIVTTKSGVEQATKLLQEVCTESFSIYQAMITAGIAREMARMVLPLNIYTYFYATWDLKNLLHFITLREDAHAQAEIQVYGKAIKALLVKLFPWTMEAYEKFKFRLVEDAI
jgi:thymidylate synthase (FAD)